MIRIQNFAHIFVYSHLTTAPQIAQIAEDECNIGTGSIVLCITVVEGFAYFWGGFVTG
jgi:hypothetical protein